jgi:hypothetical protein
VTRTAEADARLSRPGGRGPRAARSAGRTRRSPGARPDDA